MTGLNIERCCLTEDVSVFIVGSLVCDLALGLIQAV